MPFSFILDICCFRFPGVLNVLLISFVARTGNPSRNGAVRKISSVIWGSSLVPKGFCSALLMVCMFRSTNPFDLGYLGLEKP